MKLLIAVAAFYVPLTVLYLVAREWGSRSK